MSCRAFSMVPEFHFGELLQAFLLLVDRRWVQEIIHIHILELLFAAGFSSSMSQASREEVLSFTMGALETLLARFDEPDPAFVRSSCKRPLSFDSGHLRDHSVLLRDHLDLLRDIRLELLDLHLAGVDLAGCAQEST